LEVLTHINKRVKPHQAIQLPLEQLLDRFLDSGASAAEKNFAMLYLDMGLERSELKIQQFVVFTLLSRLGAMASSSSPQHADTTLQLFLSTCDKFKLTKESVFDNPTKVVLLDFIYDVLLYVPLMAAPAPSVNANAAPANAEAGNQPQQQEAAPQNQLPPGMSEKSKQRVLGASQTGAVARFAHWKVDDWAQKKTYLCTDFLLEGALNGVFSESEVFVPLLLASADGNARVQRAGEDALKRLPRVMLEERPVVDKLYLMVTGNASNAKLTAAEKRTPTSNIVRVKAFEQLVRSQLALNSFPQNLQAAFEALFGAATSPKLKMQGLGFVQAAIRAATELTLKLFGPVVLNGALLKLLREISKDESTQNAQLRAGVYQSIGALSKRLPALFSSNVDLLREFFDALPTESEVSVRVTLQEALADLSAAFASKTSSDSNLSESILNLLLNVVETRQDVPSRYLAVFYANRLFSFSNPRARHIDLVCASDMQRQVADEARRGLSPFKCVDNNPVADSTAEFPDFTDFMTHIASAAVKNRESTPKGQPRVSFNQLTMKELMEFVRSMIQHHLERPGASSQSFLDSIQHKEPHPLAAFRELLLEALAPTSTVDVIHASARALLDLFCAFPQWSIGFFASSQQHQQTLIHLMSRGRPESRRLIAKCVALVVPQLSAESRTQLFKDQLSSLASGRSVLRRDEQIGACLTLGAAVSRCVETQLSQDIKSNPFNIIGTALVQEIVQTLRSWTELETNYSEPAAEAIGQIGRFAPLPVDASVVDEIISNIAKHIGTAGVSTEAIETFSVALANLTLGDRTLAGNQKLLEAIYSTNKVKQEELHFTVGDALSCIGAGWLSSASADSLLPASMAFSSITTSLKEQDVSTDRVEPILNKLMESFILGDRADARAAAAIWLLCLLKSAGSTSLSIKKQLKRIQTAFTHLLAENNEVIQEAAAKGIVLVYELGDASTQNSLIDTLVNTLQSGAKGFKMTEDSEILPNTAENAPKAASGQQASSSSGGAPQLSTYKELLSLASEMNQPDLVYRFMNLSTHHALWNSKKGAAFATKTLASKAADRLKPQLPELIPKLFRASYDPNPKIAASMTNILNSLVEDTNEITAADSPYFAGIMKDLIENMFNKQWRTREASCLALSDVLISKTFAQVGPFLSDLWEKCFKVIDDIKETVRKAAEQLCKSLSSLTLRLCDPSYTNIEDVRFHLTLFEAGFLCFWCLSGSPRC
jgi:proteasome component ECM29